MWLTKTGVYMLCLGVFVAPFLALAHATPIAYTPAAGATELETPSSISIRFTERIEMGASSLTVFGPNGEEVNQGKGEFVADDERVLAVPIVDAGNGVYTTSWQVVSVDDGHFTKGAFSFLVDPQGNVFEGTQEGVEITYSSKLPEAILSFLNLLGESIYLALFVFTAFILKPLYRRKEISPMLLSSVSKVLSHLALLAFLLFAAGSIIAFVRKSAELALLQKTSFLESSLVYLNSSVGTFIAFKVVLITALCVVFVLFQKKFWGSSSKTVFVVSLLLLGAVLYMQAYVSHAAASFFLPEFSVFVTFLHLAAKEFIIGGVALLLTLLFFFAHKDAVDTFRKCAVYFDFLASAGLLVAALSGVYITWLHLKHVENLEMTEWGTRFLTLLSATLIFGAFRMFHQFVVHPRLHKGRWQKILSISLFGELTAGLLVLFISGYISITTPPFTVEEYSFSRSAIAEGLVVSLDVHPLEHDSFRVSLVDTAAQKKVDAEQLTITATNVQKAIGPNVIQVQRRSQGVYVFPLTSLSPEGGWELAIIAKQKEGYDAQASFDVVYPDDITQSKHSDDSRTFDGFALLMIALGSGLLVFSIILSVFSLMQIQGLKVKAIVVNFIDTQSVAVWAFRMGVALLVLTVFFILLISLGQASFERVCIQDGHQWRQAFPTRDFEATSPNALNGCTVHEGHYHFVDEEEYAEFMNSQ